MTGMERPDQDGHGLNRPDYLRVGDAERDEVAVSLHDHFVQGRLTRDELDERLEITLRAKTVGDLREVVRDLPGPHAGPVADAPARAGERTGARPPVWAHRAGHRPLGGGPRWGHHHLHRHAPVAPLLLGLFVVTAVVAGPAWALFAVLKVALFGWLALAIIGIPLHRHRRAAALGSGKGAGEP